METQNNEDIKINQSSENVNDLTQIETALTPKHDQASSCWY